MIDAEHLHSRLELGIQRAIKPMQVLLLDVAVAHLHERSTIHTDNQQIVDSKDKTVGTPQVIEGLASALAPGVFVITRDNILWMSNLVENAFNIFQLFVIAVVGKIASNHNGINIQSIDLINGLTQLHVVDIARSHMYITQDGKFDHPTLHGKRQGRHRKQQR